VVIVNCFEEIMKIEILSSLDEIHDIVMLSAELHDKRKLIKFYASSAFNHSWFKQESKE
jgi:hypothetical protein